MESFSCVFGNEKLRERLASDIREGMMSHAYIIEGDKGCGKHTLARAVAAALACENAGDGGYNLPCGVCPSCKKILAGKSPDVITVSREAGKTQMGVEVIRGLREDVRLMPNDLDVKVYIIEDAHTMNDHAQNAFLLTLEEPPEFVKFLLLCESSENLLETVKSRAPVLRMSTLENALLRQKLIEISPEAAELSRNSKKEFEEIIKLSSGCLGQAIELLSEDTRAPRIEARHLALELILCLTERRNAKKAVDILSRFSKKRDELIYQLSEIESAIRDLILTKKCESAPLCFFVAEEEAFEIAYNFKLTTLLKIFESVGRAKSSLNINGNVRLTLFALFADTGLL